MTRWWNGSCVGLDFESDHRDPEEARIISANVTIVRPGARPVVHDWIVQPERDIPAEAVAVHHITTEYAREHGKPRGDAIADIVAILGAANESTPLVAHNAPYDCTLLDRELRRLSYGHLSQHVDTGLVSIRAGSGFGEHVTHFPVLDTLVLDKALDPYRPGKGGRRLSNAAPLYGVTLTERDAHTAGADVRASVQMLIEIARRCSMRHDHLVALYPGRRKPHDIAKKFAEVCDLSLVKLHERQVEWAAEQAAGLAQWARNNPDKTDIDPDTVSGTWPLRWWKEGPS